MSKNVRKCPLKQSSIFAPSGKMRCFAELLSADVKDGEDKEELVCGVCGVLFKFHASGWQGSGQA